MSISSSCSKRIHLIDELRGFAILCMMVYHAVFDLLLLFPSISFPFFFSPVMNTIRNIFAGLFIFISGTACRFSHNNFKRGLICLGFGIIMTIGTYLFVPQQLIVFGILHMLGCSMILFSLIRLPLDKISPKLALGICIFLFVFTWGIGEHYVGIPYLIEIPLPDSWYQTNWFSPLGFYNRFFHSGDYFPLLPWFFLFLSGTIVGTKLKNGAFPQPFYELHFPRLAAIGRHTLWVYLLHQPILFAIFGLIQML